MLKLRNAVVKTGCDFRQIMKALQQFWRKFAATSLCFVKHLYYRATGFLGAPTPDKPWGEMLFHGLQPYQEV